MPNFRSKILRGLAVAAAMSIAWGPAIAQDEMTEQATGALNLELNGLEPTDGGCRFTFVVENALEANLSRAAFELVLFDKNGLVDRLTIVDFLDLPAGKTKVRQFDFNGTDCAEVGRVLVNDATECAGEGIAPEACIRKLSTSTTAEIEFGS